MSRHADFVPAAICIAKASRHCLRFGEAVTFGTHGKNDRNITLKGEVEDDQVGLFFESIGLGGDFVANQASRSNCGFISMSGIRNCANGYKQEARANGNR